MHNILSIPHTKQRVVVGITISAHRAVQLQIGIALYRHTCTHSTATLSSWPHRCCSLLCLRCGIAEVFPVVEGVWEGACSAGERWGETIVKHFHNKGPCVYTGTDILYMWSYVINVYHRHTCRSCLPLLHLMTGAGM